MYKCKRCALGSSRCGACSHSLEASLADDPKRVGKSDRSRVSPQDHEVKCAARKTGSSSAEVRFVDEERQRILAAVEQKVAGQQIVAPDVTEGSGSAEVIDLMAALRASLKSLPGNRQTAPGSTTGSQTRPRKAVRRPAKSIEQRAKPRKAAARN